jgi:NAD(P)-dependent dehydrogenase (short-subunit alcohol dehydrogenase family)
LLADASNLVLLGSRSIEKGEAAVKDLKARNLPGKVELVQIDVTSDESIEKAAKQVQEKHGRYVPSQAQPNSSFQLARDEELMP